MRKLITQRLNEDMTKSDVKNQIEKYISSSDFKVKIENIIKDRIRTEKVLEDKVVEITKNVLAQLYKTLWTKKSFWSTTLTGKKN